MTWLTRATKLATASANSPSGFNKVHTAMPPEVMTISSLSPLSRVST